MSKNEITDQIMHAAAEVEQWFAVQDPDRFTYAPPGKWTAGQHLDHLNRSLQPFVKALRAPKLVLRLTFGKPNREMRSYAALKDKYDRGIAEGFKTTGQFIPPDVHEVAKVDLLSKYHSLNDSLTAALTRWSESQLDRYLLPHPALGKLMIREMLYFTHIHTEHHLRLLREQYTSQS